MPMQSCAQIKSEDASKDFVPCAERSSSSQSAIVDTESPTGRRCVCVKAWRLIHAALIPEFRLGQVIHRTGCPIKERWKAIQPSHHTETPPVGPLRGLMASPRTLWKGDWKSPMAATPNIERRNSSSEAQQLKVTAM
ncbi:hypothetical protein ACSS6W_004086 [Trichoderma asperelloides]